MCLEFLIAGLTGFFSWLLIRHVIAFKRERNCQRAGTLLREVKLSRKGVFLRITAGLFSALMLCAMLIAQDYMSFFFKIKWGDSIEISPFSMVPGSNVIVEIHTCIIVFVALNFCSFSLRHARLSFAIRENGLVFGFPAGFLYFPWEKIQYCIWSPTKKKLYVQERGHLSFLRKRLYVDDHETVLAMLGQFVEIRDQEQKVLFQPAPPRDKS
jgi:hypothetical protein